VQEGFILSQVRRCNRNLLLVNLTIIFVVAFIVSLSYRYFYNILFGPFAMDAVSVTALNDPDTLKHKLVTVKGIDVGHSGLQYLETTYDEETNEVIRTRVISDYIYLQFFHKLLVVKAPPGEEKLSYTGWLQKMPEDLKAELMSAAAEEDVSAEDFNQIVLPVMLDAQYNRAEGYAALLLLAPFFFIPAWNLAKYGLRTADPTVHPIYKKLGAFGNPESVAKDIDEDIAGNGVQLPQGVVVSHGWFAKEKLFGLTLVPLHNVHWVYKHITRQTIEYIPAGKAYSLAFHLNNRQVLHIYMKQKNVDAAIEAIQAKAPGIVSGYSDDLAALWNTSYADFVAAIEKENNAG